MDSVISITTPYALHPDQPHDLDRYIFIKEIGRGSFSTVYLACRIPSSSASSINDEGKYVAIKVIQRRKITKKLEFHLRQEITILKKLNEQSDGNFLCKNIIKFYEMIKCKNVICIVMEWCSLGDLTTLLSEQRQVDRYHSTQRQAIQRKPELSKTTSSLNFKYPPLYWTRESNVKSLIFQLASGLKALHTLGLVHRDIKPQNLLFVKAVGDGDPNSLANEEYGPCTYFSAYILKIADFGFARYMNPSDMADTMCGSPLYMAPEILLNEKYDARADLWSVGCIMFELLFARGPPFRAPNHITLAKKYQDTDLVKRLFAKLSKEGAPEVWSSLSPECLDLLHGLLKVDPVSRISFDDFFSHTWFKEIVDKSLILAKSLPYISTQIDVIQVNPLKEDPQVNNRKIPVTSALRLFPQFLQQKKTLTRIIYSIQIFLVKLRTFFITGAHFQLIVQILSAMEEVLQVSALLAYCDLFDKGRYLFQELVTLADNSQFSINKSSLDQINNRETIQQLFDELIFELNASPEDTEWISWLEHKISKLF